MHQNLFLSLLTSALLARGFASPVASITSQLPVVDLAYTQQRASSFNETGQYYGFSNIAYAKPPVGTLRWAGPQPPSINRSVQDPGPDPINCPQAIPIWLSNQVGELPPSVQSEDCLYLDVFVPESTFRESRKGFRGAPVFVWIHGGGFVLGSKTSNGSPAGLLAKEAAKKEGMIFVALNYRLGAFGFLNGPEFNAQSGVANAGLLDQRLALDWIQKNIHRFGGNAERITLVGESGGATSLVAHLAADTREFGALSVERALFQSTANLFEVSDSEQNSIFSNWLSTTSARNLEQARGLDTQTLQTANRDTIKNASFGTFLFNTEVKNTPGSYLKRNIQSSIRLFAKQRRDLEVMVGYNAREGALFTQNTNATFRSFVTEFLGNASQAQLSRIESLYPPHSPATPYTDESTRRELLVAESSFVCEAYTTSTAFNGSGFAYRFSMPPGYHTQDLDYTFYNGANVIQGTVNGKVANSMQEYFVSFATKGHAKASGRLNMPRYERGQLLDLKSEKFSIIADPANTERCKFWSQS